MNGIRALLLCGNRFALQVMQELAFKNQLAAVVVPAHCDEWLEHIAAVFQGAEIPLVVVTRDNCEAELQNAFNAYSANLGLMITFSFRIPPSVISIPEKGFYNVHPGALPEYRGPDPIFQQIKNRERFAAVTIHHVAEAWDSGAVVMRERIALQPADTHGILSFRLSVVAARLVANMIKVLGFESPLAGREQETEHAHYYRKQTAKDVSIDWNAMEAADIVALINACNPWNKGASARLGPKILKLTEAHVVSVAASAAPGTITALEGGQMIIACNWGKRALRNDHSRR